MDRVAPRYQTGVATQKPSSSFRRTMKPQARAFSVEIKSRKRPTSPAVAASAAAGQDDWVDLIPPDDVPERDVHEDLADPSVQSEARRQAERLFGRLGGDAQPVE